MERLTDILGAADVWIVVGLVSAVMFGATLLAIPWLVARLPVDHFVGARGVLQPESRHPLLAFARRLARNTLGIVLVLAGLAMLVLPGQGVLTVLLGVVLLDFPGKRGLQQRLLRQRHVRKSLQWLRKRAGREPLVFEDSIGDDADPSSRTDPA
ncbi:MAG: PGPGW domain-containing protein [Nannocystales bacterium]